MNPLIVTLCLTAVIGVTRATDYCNTTLCNKGVKHIACGSTDFGPECPRNAAEVPLDDAFKAKIVRAHNEKRNLVAGGGVNGLEPACRMATMEWDDELARLAGYNARRCQMFHDQCRNTETFKYAGQNLAWTTYQGRPSPEGLFEDTFDMWYDEVKNVKMSHINLFPVGYKGPKIGHVTVMLADRNIRVGCAAVTYESPYSPTETFSITCNYATTNMVGFPIYKSCSSAGSSCTTGTNPQYPNLCSTSEKYDVNKWY
ncbi:antigen 5 like allergen Cul n 1-like [Musca vetustissima]|uniref:antigen 5 like allergen Cul n 1-like n=1 Tax=Musca vetustissima TaxID=27455 RepID=UPI002AB73048|nr:antigen 5 like allergen Cul n 1-like [Musca vetustissima]XP_061393339.1 antigen 5 like allergen Cul n 1-like [Musca vetustissima]